MSSDDPTVARLIARGAAEHPGIAEPPGLRERLADCLARGDGGLERRAADLYLAAACVAGDPAAIAVLDATLAATIRPALARLGIPPSDDDEIVQRVRVALLVRDEAGACGLATYTGRGELRAYLRSAAVRIALKRLEREPAPAPDDPDEILAWFQDPAESPELALRKRRYCDDLRAAFAHGLAALSPRERTVLRQHYLDGLTIDVLGPLHDVHRSTCARWIEAARVKLLREVRSHLRDNPALDARELEAAVALVQSQLDLSLYRHLASRDAGNTAE